MANSTFAPHLSPFNTQPIGLPPKASIAVVGAGAFGGWTALYLQRAGYQVTLIDSWGPGNSRSSSGDETRVIRSTYGANEFYFDLNVRALQLWKENELRWNKKLFYNQGVIWLCYEEHTPLVDASIPFALRHNMPYEHLTISELQQRYPLIHTGDLHHAWLDPFGGYLKARESMQIVKESFIAEGGNYLQATVKPGTIASQKMNTITLSDNTTLTADLYVFACGSWMGQLFPEAVKQRITCTRQEVYYFGVPAARSKAFDSLPVWIDVDGTDFYYGIPGNAYRGFKIGVDIRGEVFDPTHSDRIPNAATVAKARAFITHRFPHLKDAPLLESRVCPYENSPDGNFIFEPHPEAQNVLLLGGGSGHGFKHGPALGELIARIIQG